MIPQRNFYPGDKWVFFKIYTSPINANQLLIYAIYPLISVWMENKVIEKWFFIRYSDPDYHLRVRVELTYMSNLGKVLEEMRDVLALEISKNVVYKIQIDTYQREIERYGADTILYCENFFLEDSERVVELLKSVECEHDLLINSLVWLYVFLYRINMSSTEIQTFISVMVLNYKTEFDFFYEQEKIINNKYRLIKRNIFDRMSMLTMNLDKVQIDIDWLVAKSSNIQLISSLIHMHMNRLFTTNQRLYEYIVYHMLQKTLDGLIKQNGKLPLFDI